MGLKTRIKKYKKTKKGRSRFTSLFFIFTLLGGLLAGGYLYYQLRSVPDLNEQYQVTVLPEEFRHVLGAQTGKTISPEPSIKIPIFLYHYIEYVQDKNDTTRQKLNITPDTLTAQIETLKAAGYTFITPSDLADDLSGKKTLPQKIVMLTFDDGYMDFYTNVFPILKKENVRATIYVIPNFLDRPNFMFTLQLKELAKSPLIEVGAHTMNHVWLKGVDKKTATYEITESRTVLQKMLNLPINSFAYPYGAFDAQAVDIVQKAGFTNGISTVPGIVQTKDNQYFLFRLRLGYRTGQGLLDYINQKSFKPW